LKSQTLIDLNELAIDLKEKTLQLWNASLPCKRIELEQFTIWHL